MTEQEDPSRERLKNHFAQRVTHQARQILEIWQRLQAQSNGRLPAWNELSDANLRLLRFAERFEQPEHSNWPGHHETLKRRGRQPRPPEQHLITLNSTA
jgi:hypothetical protein